MVVGEDEGGRPHLERTPDDLAENDLRRTMPRFQAENLDRNLALYERFNALAAGLGCTPAQLSLAWLLTRSERVVPIPGTTSLQHMRENFAAASIAVPAAMLAEIDFLLAPGTVAGARYPAAALAEVDTEDF
jgi:aryl-alcohol dehydrogenase-like predicted oxidoreductase